MRETPIPMIDAASAMTVAVGLTAAAAEALTPPAEEVPLLPPPTRVGVEA